MADQTMFSGFSWQKKINTVYSVKMKVQTTWIQVKHCRKCCR